MSKTIKVEIPSSTYDATLKFVNEIRQKHNVKPLKALLPGKPGGVCECPISKSILKDTKNQYHVQTRKALIRTYDFDSKVSSLYHLPNEVIEFVKIIDDQYYHLKVKPVRKTSEVKN